MIIFCDIDHTLSDAAWRDSLLGEWDSYHASSINDQPIWPMVNLIAALSACGNIIIAHTTRPEKWRQLTMQWLLKYHVQFDMLIMRDTGDFRPSHEIKIEQAKKYCDEMKFWVIDDNERVLQAYQAIGIGTIQISVTHDRIELYFA